MENSVLEHLLKPLQPWLEDSEVSEISINCPQEVFIEKKSSMSKYIVPELDLEKIKLISQLAATFNGQRFSESEPLLSGSLPGGERIQLAQPPACEPGNIAISIRKQIKPRSSLDELFQDGFFAELTSPEGGIAGLEQAVLDKKNILISGGTGSGKTTLMNACINAIPTNERIITLEDTREIQVPHENKLHLLAARGAQTAAQLTMTQLIEASLRLRPDRIIIGEIRGEEAAAFLDAIATGHDGSLATIHASNTKLALVQLAVKAERGGLKQQSRQELLDYIESIIDIVIQVKRFPDGSRRIVDYSEVKHYKEIGFFDDLCGIN